MTESYVYGTPDMTLQKMGGNYRSVKTTLSQEPPLKEAFERFVEVVGHTETMVRPRTSTARRGPDDNVSVRWPLKAMQPITQESRR